MSFVCFLIEECCIFSSQTTLFSHRIEERWEDGASEQDEADGRATCCIFIYLVEKDLKNLS